MTETEIRIAIAEKCGRVRGFGSACPICGSLSSRHECFSDCPNDLNAVHEAEKLLYPVTGNEWNKYEEWLRHITVQDAIHNRYTFHATPRQRCEALLRTWGLWKE